MGDLFGEIAAEGLAQFFPTITLCELFHKSIGLSDSAGMNPRNLLGNLYSAATAAVAPGPALLAQLERLAIPSSRRVWIVALGKAAEPMADAALQTLRSRGVKPAGGLVVSPAPVQHPDPALLYVVGDHPEPGPGSLSAAEALAETAGQIGNDDEVWLLLSGGTSSLIAAPESGMTPLELGTMYSLLLGSGLDIRAMNRIRKRFSRWGAGKLARALAPALVRSYIVSDVIGDELASIGSGPCVPDATTATEVREALEGAGLWQRIPHSARSFLGAVEAGEKAETPKPGDRLFENVKLELIASNRLALDAASARARELGLDSTVVDGPILGQAAATGATLAAALLEHCAQPKVEARRLGSCLIWGGETTVSLGEGPFGLGGRCQELALSAARVLAGTAGVALLAAGTDGRDGPTDAAGAIVDGSTWRTIAGSGRDPARDLAQHDAYPALNAAGALLRPGLTGTNVMDVVIGLCLP
jgi:glycerate 2-kinase